MHAHAWQSVEYSAHCTVASFPTKERTEGKFAQIQSQDSEQTLEFNMAAMICDLVGVHNFHACVENPTAARLLQL